MANRMPKYKKIGIIQLFQYDKLNIILKIADQIVKESGYNPEVKFSLLSGLKGDIKI